MKPVERTTLSEVIRMAGSTFTEKEVTEAMNIFEEYSKKMNGEDNAAKMYNISAIFAVFVAGYIHRIKEQGEYAAAKVRS